MKSASRDGASITSFPQSGLQSASKPGRTAYGMPASPLRWMPTAATCAPCSSTPAMQTRRRRSAMTITAATLRLPARLPPGSRARSRAETALKKKSCCQPAGVSGTEQPSRNLIAVQLTRGGSARSLFSAAASHSRLDVPECLPLPEIDGAAIPAAKGIPLAGNEWISVEARRIVVRRV